MSAWPSPPDRIVWLDGIRGWASLMVLFAHLIFCFLALSTPDYQHAALRFAGDGHLAVYIFFVLSGFALTAGHITAPAQNLQRAVATRYLRLALPIFATSLVAYGLLKLHLFYNLAAATSPEKSSGWLGTFYNFEPSVTHLLKFSFFDVFFKYDGATSYNSSLWTMPVELCGSYLIYAILAIFRQDARINGRVLGVIALVLLHLNPMLCCFIGGCALAQWHGNDEQRLTESQGNLIGGFGLGMVIGLSTFFRPSHDVWVCGMAMCLVASVTASSILQNFFQNTLSQFLGRISFPLYLIQIPIICSWSSYLFIRLAQSGLDRLTQSNIILASSVALCLISAWLLLPVETGSIRLAKQLVKRFIVTA